MKKLVALVIISAATFTGCCIKKQPQHVDTTKFKLICVEVGDKGIACSGEVKDTEK